MEDPMSDLLQMHDIEKYYGLVKALDRAVLNVREGEVHALLGANGAGKSTLMKVQLRREKKTDTASSAEALKMNLLPTCLSSLKLLNPCFQKIRWESA